MQMIAALLIKLLNAYTLIIFIQCLMSWFPGARYSKPYEILSMLTEPVVGPIREVLFKFIDIPIDFSPIVVIFIITLLQRLIITIAW